MKTFVLIILVVMLAGAAGAFFFLKNRAPQLSAEQPAEKRRVVEPENDIELAERPYVKIEPVDGRNVSINIVVVNKPARQVEYELEYQAGSLLQGAFGLIKLDTLPVAEQILLGSCSAGGACTFHQDVRGGTLLLRFDGAEPYVLKQDWRYIDNATRDNQVSSRDAKFQLDSNDLSQQRYLIVYNSPGLPAPLPAGQVVSDLYALTSSGSLRGQGELTIRAQEAGDLTIYGWDGTDWQAFETSSDGKAGTARVELVELYAVGRSQ
ncbi:MAG: hypothetical protein COU69_01785 [Candidatus Pacebacteria bacterium CG10_big_fil_rev_8_21_14_0_10_56_10]|nr:MAG: hypothetical protein COU69_01785 [Candidatus Pacebacteria bacterium CG10_big_fil_rev_8_21_14_0_10_56_10]